MTPLHHACPPALRLPATRCATRCATVASVAIVGVVGVVAAAAGLLTACQPPLPGLELTKGFDASRHGAYFPIDADATHAVGRPTFTGEPMSCGACHDGGASFKEFFCVRCHDQDPSFGESHQRVDGYIRADASCLACHADGKIPEGLSHPYFPIGADDVHNSANPAYLARESAFGATGCDACHVEGQDKTAVRCAECHAVDEPTIESVHGADATMRASFQNQPADCKVCHASTPVPESMRAAPHERAVSFWPHAGATLCAQCHAAGAATPELPRLQPPLEHAADFSVVRCDTRSSCLGCHQAGLDNGRGCAFETPVGNDAGPGGNDAGPGGNDAGPGGNDAGPGVDAGPPACLRDAAESEVEFINLGIAPTLVGCMNCHGGAPTSPTANGPAWGPSVSQPSPADWHVAFHAKVTQRTPDPDNLRQHTLYTHVNGVGVHNRPAAQPLVEQWLGFVTTCP